MNKAFSYESFDNLNELAGRLLSEDLNHEDSVTLQLAITLCEYLTNEQEEEIRDHHFSIPINSDFPDLDYPI